MEAGAGAGSEDLLAVGPGEEVWGVWEGRAAVLRNGQTEMVKARRILLRAGVRERIVAFPGWELPGVRSGAGLQLAPDPRWRSAVVALDSERRAALVAELKARALEVIVLDERATVVAAAGSGRLESIDVVETNAQGRLRLGTRRRLNCDGLYVGWGQVPALELARAAGCAVRYDRACGAFVPRTDVGGRTSLSWLLIEQPALASPRRSWMALDGLARADTVICRCQGTTLGAFLEGLPFPTTDANVARAGTRVGMGACQGRDCEPAVAAALARLARQPVGRITPFTFRPPVQPLPIAAVAATAQPPPLELVFP